MGCPTCQQQTAHVHGFHEHNHHSHHAPCVDCGAPACETPQPCTEITDAQCTIYTGANIKCGSDIVIMQNDNIATALSKVTAYFCSKQGLVTTENILCGSEVIIPVGVGVQEALELTIAFICQIQLTPGPQGTTGAQGVQGTTGSQGLNGLQGIQGPQGTIGVGTQGTQGIQGVAGSPTAGTLVGLFAQTDESIEVTNSNSPNYLVGNGVGILTVPANGFQIGDSFKSTMHGLLSCANNQTLRLSVMANSIELATTPSMILPQINGKNFTLDLDFTVRAIGGAGVAEIVTAGKFSYNKDANNVFEGFNFSFIDNTTFDTTILNLLMIKAEWQTNDGSNRIQSQMFNLFKTF